MAVNTILKLWKFMLFQVELELSLGVQIKATLYLAKNRYRTHLRARI